MIGRDEPVRISQTALTKAGALGLARALDKREGENLAGLLKYMVEKSAVASGRKRSAIRSTANRRRYGDFVLILKGKVLVDVLASRPDWCVDCLGTERGLGCRCS